LATHKLPLALLTSGKFTGGFFVANFVAASSEKCGALAFLKVSRIREQMQNRRVACNAGENW